MAEKGRRVLDRISKKTAAGIGVFLLGFLLFGKIAYLTEEPGKDKDCDPLNPEASEHNKPTTVELSGENLNWIQRGGTIDDASCLDETAVSGVIAIMYESDIQEALNYARENNLKVSIAGVKHSMGGHAFAKNALVLDMTGFNFVRVNDSGKTITVQSGATWHDIQTKIHPHYAVMAMQSTDIFTVGGSISVNAHGMDHQAGAVENSIVSMRVLTPDGAIHSISRSVEPELYHLVVGGYGLFGIILDVELRLADNDLYASSREIISYRDFPTLFENEIEPNKKIGLMYTHLSTSPGNSFLDEAIVYRYEKSDEVVPVAEIPPLAEISSVKLRRLVMNLSKYGGVFQTMRWWSEKYLEPKMESCTISRNVAQSSGEACLVTRNEPMHDSVPYLKNSLKRETDILHEYFIPRRNIVAFIDGLREIVREEDVNLLNASIRVVHKERGFLSYAPEEAFSVVLYINQKTDAEGNERMRVATSKLIDLSTRLEGRFFLPYQLHYSGDQLRASYPNIDQFFSFKRAYDPEELLTNTWYEKYGKS